ncbi:hypothetical protein FRC06_000112 [Ceratobasidium sp. 370]|nr:hypothetical protein FRC06_000112 [Ceratobasidium sp. 370]
MRLSAPLLPLPTTQPDITGQTDTQAMHKRILSSKLYIPDGLHPSFAVYRIELGGFATSGAPDNNQLLIDCQHFGDDGGSLKFLAYHPDTPTHDVDISIMPPSNSPVPLLLPSLPTFSPYAMHMPEVPRPLTTIPEGHANGYEASVCDLGFDTPNSESTSPHLQTCSPTQTLRCQAASQRDHQPPSSPPIPRRQAQQRGSGSGPGPAKPVFVT